VQTPTRLVGRESCGFILCGDAVGSSNAVPGKVAMFAAALSKVGVAGFATAVPAATSAMPLIRLLSHDTDQRLASISNHQKLAMLRTHEHWPASSIPFWERCCRQKPSYRAALIVPLAYAAHARATLAFVTERSRGLSIWHIGRTPVLSAFFA
jgi:hypothetical protein